MSEQVFTVEDIRGLDLGMFSPEEQGALLEMAMADLARAEDTPDAFEAFYELVIGQPLPEHALEEWVKPLYEARAWGLGVVIEAFRGSTKTTTLTIAFTAWRIGKEPQRANLLIQVGDDIAADNTAQIADIIANSAAWKRIFPNIEPDRERGWGAGGYEVKRTDITYSEWRAICAARKDPTLVGVGYKSREIIGKHPDGVLLIDDIHDENNTSSERELEMVRKILLGTIFPAKTETTWMAFVGTPWVPNDVLNYVASTGLFVHIKTPVYRLDPGGEEFEGQMVRFTWREVFGPEAVAVAKKLAMRVQFARMFLLDLTEAHNRVFKYQDFPASEIRYNWPMVGGCDYASSGDPYKNKAGKLDFFALCYIAKLPGGGAVVVDGVVDHCTQAQAEHYLMRAQQMYPNWGTTMVESNGKGDDFIQVIRRNPKLLIIPQPAGRLKKERRLEQLLGPWLENGAIRISDADTPFLAELRRELDAYPNHTHDDAMDSLYYAMRNIPDVLVVQDVDEIPEAARKKRRRNPFLSLGRA